MVFSLIEPKERINSSQITLVGWPILFVGVARRSYTFNISSIIFRSDNLSWLLDLEMERKENKLSRDSLDNHNDVADTVGDFFRLSIVNVVKSSFSYDGKNTFILLLTRQRHFKNGKWSEDSLWRLEFFRRNLILFR